MPQAFQVLKCFKCFVFQVHQTKKSNKWECKLCGEKQLIKRHYGRGTGKECRLHVQKLNCIRGEVEESNNKIKHSESSDEEITSDVIVLNQKQSNVTSKWSEYIDKTEELHVLEAEFIGDAKVVLETPNKRRKFQKPIATKNPAAKLKLTFSKYKSIDNAHKFQTQMHDVDESFLLSDTANSKTTKEDELSLRKQTDSFAHKPEIKSFVPHVVNKSSKWAQFTADEEHDDYEDSGANENNDEILQITKNAIEVQVSSERNATISKNPSESSIKNLNNNIFSQCEENDLDDVLDI